jgi:hypothetical protein
VPYIEFRKNLAKDPKDARGILLKSLKYSGP